MASTYYKYVNRDADSQVNWAEVGREFSGMIMDVQRVRDEKKEAYNQATREEMNNLMNTPQGENQDANNFINNYAHDMINQMKIDEDLFKRGWLKERDYTLKRQNNMDGTKQLFEIQKLYQEKHKEKMEGVLSGKLQAINIFNMGMVEGYGDFNNSKATINPADGTVGIGLMENKIIDGKSVRVLSKNIAPVNVIRGKILQDVPTFDVDAATTATVATFGKRKDVIYNQATTAGAGSIYEYLGIDFLGTLKDPVDIKIVNDMNKAINDQVDSFLSPYNITSVLTENLRKYSDKSFTFDKDEADKDPNKILVKVDPNTQMTTLDEKGKNYNAQKAEAAQWVRDDILRKMDQERDVKPTPQNQLQETAKQKAQAENMYRPRTSEENDQQSTEQNAENFAANVAFLQTGTDAQKAAAAGYFRSRGADIRSNPAGQPAGNYIMTKNGLVAFKSQGDVFGQSKSIIGPLLSATDSDIPEDMVVNAIKNKVKGKNFNTTYSGTGAAIDIEGEVKKKVAKVTDVSLFTNKNSTKTANAIKKQIGTIPGIIIKAEGGGAFKGNKITITKKGAPTLIINSNESGTTAADQSRDLKDWLEANLTDAEKNILAGVKAGGNSGGNVR